MELGLAAAYPSSMVTRARKRARSCEPASRDEQQAFIRSLEAHGQAVEGKGPLPPGATHRLTVRKHGAKRVKRKRFSAV